MRSLLLLRGLCSASPAGQPDPRPHTSPDPDPDPDPRLVGALCRVLSDFRGPRHDLRAALNGFAPRLTPAAAAAVLRRCRNLPVPSLRIFLFAAALPGFTHLPESLLILAGSLAGAQLFPLLRSLLSDLPRPALSRDLFPLLVGRRIVEAEEWDGGEQRNQEEEEEQRNQEEQRTCSRMQRFGSSLLER